MTATTRKLLLLLVLVIIWGLVWRARIDGWEGFHLFHHKPATADAPARSAQPAPPAPPAPSVPVTVADGTAPVLATIDWADPANPAAIPLGWRGRQFLFDTTSGLQVWDSERGSLSPLDAVAPDARLIDTAWVRAALDLRNGTLFAVRARPDSRRAALYWADGERQQVGAHLLLPEDFTPSTMVPVAQNLALVCATAQPALLVKLAAGRLTLMSESPGLEGTNLWRQVMAADVVGPVAGFDSMGAHDSATGPTHNQPLVFDTRACAWKAAELPAPLAGAQELEIYPQSRGRTKAIVAASWRDPSTGKPRTLDTPLVWSGEENAWRARKTTDLAALAPAQLAGIGAEPWSYAADVAQGRFAFLGEAENRWREATLRLPAASGLKLLPIGPESVLALRLEPQAEAWIATRFPRTVSDESTVIPLAGGSAMLIGGDSRGGMLVQRAAPHGSTLPALSNLPDLPQSGTRYAGMQLADGSVVVFGSRPRDCYDDSRPDCGHGPNAGLRWVPGEQRWQPLPTLNVPFAPGDAFDGGSYSVIASYGRNDVALRGGNELYYLGGNEAWRGGDDRAEPTTLYRWRLDGGTQALARTRRPRANASLIVLDDGRLAALGGSAADDAQAPGDRLSFTDTCEIYDPRADRWSPGPRAHHPRGRAVKLANGRIFKLGLLGYQAADAGYAAETANPTLTAWEAAPPFPLRQGAAIRLMQAVGNQVLIVMNQPSDRYVLWDDDSRSWQVRPLPPHAEWGLDNRPLGIVPGGDGKVLMIYPRSFDELSWP